MVTRWKILYPLTNQTLLSFWSLIFKMTFYVWEIERQRVKVAPGCLESMIYGSSCLVFKKY